jgi:DNA-binding Xre family transcriptional regulator
MTIRAYAETYLDDAMNNLGDMFDYAVYDCKYALSEFYDFFLASGVAESFGKGNPKYIAGLSGPELASEVIRRTKGARPDAPISENIDKSPEYWVGWILAYYQWYTAYSFTELYENGLTAEHLLNLYHPYHEADVTKFVDAANRLIETNAKTRVSNLQRIRKASGKTQKQLADESGATLRMVQLYEQKQQNINKAQAITLARLARVLGCEVEDLLENEPAAAPY